MKRKPLRRVSAKQRERQSQLKAAEPRVFERDNNECRVRISAHCTGRAEVLHHIRKRSSGWPVAVLDHDDNLLSSCWACNLAVEDFPALARELGVSKPRWAP